MNEVFGQLGESNKIKQDNQTDVQCLAACEDQINQIYISQSKLPNRWVQTWQSNLAITRQMRREQDKRHKTVRK